MRPWFDIPALEGSLVRLEPLSMGHADELALAAEEDRSSYDFTIVPRANEVGDYLVLVRRLRHLFPYQEPLHVPQPAPRSPPRPANPQLRPPNALSPRC
jgi:hypothetical protein